MKPPLSILDKRFQYTKSDETDIRQTFQRARLLQRIEAFVAPEREEQPKKEAA